MPKLFSLPSRPLRRAVFLIAALIAGAPQLVYAQASYPERQIKLIVPFAPGGTGDVLGRLIASRMGDALGQTVFVENKGGAGSILGTELGAKAEPNGYTLVMTNGAAITTGPLLGQKVGYRPIEDFSHLVLLGTFPNGLVVRADHPAKSFREFISLADKANGKFNYGSAGIGTAGFMVGELLKQKANIQLTHVPYKGTGQAMIDLLGGQLDAIFNNLGIAAAQVKAGKVRILAVSGPNRLPDFPDVPTMDSVVPGTVGEAWFGVSAPVGMPAAVVDKLVSVLAKIVATAEFKARLSEHGLTPIGAGPVDFVRFLKAEEQKWGPVIKAGNIKLD